MGNFKFDENFLKHIAMNKAGYMLNKELLKENIRNYLIDRTQQGVGYAGRPFKKYSDNYLKQKQRAGKYTGVVNISLSGDLLNSMEIVESPYGRINAGEWGRFQVVFNGSHRGVGFTSGNYLTGAIDNEELADFIIMGTEHQDYLRKKIKGSENYEYYANPKAGTTKMPARNFIGLNRLELEKIIEKTISGETYKVPGLRNL